MYSIVVTIDVKMNVKMYICSSRSRVLDRDTGKSTTSRIYQKAISDGLAGNGTNRTQERRTEGRSGRRDRQSRTPSTAGTGTVQVGSSGTTNI